MSIKIFLHLFFFSIFINSNYAQILNINKSFNDVDEISINVFIDNSNNYIISGRINDINDNSKGFIKKISSNGELLNEFTIGNEWGNSFLFKSIQNENNYISIGVISNINGKEFLYIKLDTNFDVIESKEIKFISDRSIRYYNYFINSDTVLIVSGYSYSNFDPNYKEEPFFYQISLTGDSLKLKQFNTTTNQYVYQVHESSNSNKYLAFMDGVNPVLGYSGILHLNKNFDTLEHHLFSEYVLHNYSSIRVNDSIFITSTINLIPPLDLKVCLINEYGNISNYVDLSRSESMREFPAYSPGISKNNNKYFIGATSNFDFTNPFYSNIDSWFHLIKMDENLNVFWEKWYGGDAYYSLNSVLATSDGGCLMVGTKYPHGIGNQFIQGHYIKVDANGDVQWTQEIEMPELSYKVYPNPTQSVFNIENSELNIQSIELYDISGRYLKSIQDCNNSTISIDLTPFSNGIYFAKIKSSKGVRTEKVVKK